MAARLVALTQPGGEENLQPHARTRLLCEVVSSVLPQLVTAGTLSST